MSDLKLLEPIQVGPITLKNRVMLPPLTTGYEERDGSIGERSLAFYERIAKGGTGYIVIGDVAPVMTASATPKLAMDSQIPSFAKLADVIHAHGAKVGLQIFHPEYDVPGVGRMIKLSQAAVREAQAAKAAGDEELFATKNAEAQKITNDAYAKLHHDMLCFVSEATHEQLAEIREAIAACAARAATAGVDAIEVHGDRIVGALCSTTLNHRSDEYGGSFENRTRFALEVVAAIKEAAPDLMLEYKLPIVTENPDGSPRGKGGLVPDEACQLAVLLEAAGVDMIQVAQANHTGSMADTIPPMGTREYCWTLPVAKRIKALVNIPVATVGRVVTVETGEKILQDGDADIIAYGRSLLTDPDIVNKAAAGVPVRYCLNCNKGCVDAIQSRRYASCVLNAENGDEATIYIRPGDGKKNVAVVGGGIAGMEAARVAAVRGYDVTLYEKADRLGGQIIIAAAPARKSEIMRSVEYYEAELPRLGVDIRLGQEATAEDLNAYDAAIIAVGAQNICLSVPGADGDNVVSAWDVLAGKAECSGKVVIVGGGLVGVECAEYLLERGCEVTIVEMLDKIANGESPTVLPTIQAKFAAAGVTQLTNTRITAVTPTGVEAEDADGQTVSIDGDVVVMAVGSKKLAFDETGLTVPVTYVGDCSGDRTADIAAAIRSAYSAANAL